MSLTGRVGCLQDRWGHLPVVALGETHILLEGLRLGLTLRFLLGLGVQQCDRMLVMSLLVKVEITSNKIRY